jgi:hypothetical protein
MATRLALFLSFLFAALMLMPAGAHLLALPNKIGMSAADYLVAQHVYRGWAYTAVLVFGGIGATAWLAWRVRRSSRMLAPTLVAFLCLAGTQVIFWTLVYPGNAQTASWTVLPANWEALRLRWEIGHAVSAALNIGAIVALLVALLRSDPLLPRSVLLPREVMA